jgi:hypothetical protein
MVQPAVARPSVGIGIQLVGHGTGAVVSGIQLDPDGLAYGVVAQVRVRGLPHARVRVPARLISDPSARDYRLLPSSFLILVEFEVPPLRVGIIGRRCVVCGIPLLRRGPDKGRRPRRR